MMWFFKKKQYPPKAELQIEDNWRMMTGQSGGQPVLVRLNDGAGAAVGHPGYSERISISLVLNTADAQGMPSPEENRQLQQIEDRLEELLCHDQEALLVAVITGNGEREFLFYMGDQDEFDRRTDTYFMDEFDDYDVHISFFTERNWKRYQDIAQGRYIPLTSGR